MSVNFYKSEIISRERLEALKGAPFWYVRIGTYFMRDNITGSPIRYIIEHIYNYSYQDYPVLSVNPRHFPKQDRRITLALCRQNNVWSKDARNYAIGDLEDLKTLCIKLRLSGYDLAIQPPTMTKRNFIDVVAEPLPFDTKILEKIAHTTYIVNEELL